MKTCVSLIVQTNATVPYHSQFGQLTISQTKPWDICIGSPFIMFGWKPFLRDLLGYPRYRLVGSDEEKDWTLEVSPVLLEDDALFQCQVGAADGVKPIR